MPSVDLRPLFPSPDQNQRSTGSPVDGKRSNLKQPSAPGSRLRFTGPQLVNLAFVLAACVGALFSAAYLFKGDELLHEVAAWPRELFSGRPAVIDPTSLETEHFESVVTASPLRNQSAALANNEGDPFSSSRRLLGLDSASKLTPRPNDVMSFPNSSGQPSNAITADGDALPSSVMNGMAAASPPSSMASNPATTAAQAAAGNAAQAARTTATSATSQATRAANRISRSARAATARNAARTASLRTAQPSAFKRAMTAIARSFRGPNDGKQKTAQRSSTRAQSAARTAGANRTKLANHRSNTVQRRSGVSSRAQRSAKTTAPKSSIRAANSRKGQTSSRFATRSVIISRSAGTVDPGFSRGSGSSIGGSHGPSGFSSSVGGFRSMGGGHGFGGGGRMGFGGGHGGGGRGR